MSGNSGWTCPRCDAHMDADDGECLGEYGGDPCQLPKPATMLETHGPAEVTDCGCHCTLCGAGVCRHEHPELADDLTDGVSLIAQERRRQIVTEGWTLEHDAEHIGDDLALAAVCYAMPPLWRGYRSAAAPDEDSDELVPSYWPPEWAARWWKPTCNDRIRELVKAGALIAAEIDRLQRKASEREDV